MTTAILTLSETGELKRLSEKWLKTQACQNGNTATSDELPLISFSGLFLISGIASLLALVIYLCEIIVKYNRNIAQTPEPPTNKSSGSMSIKRFLSFVDEKEEESDSRSTRKHSKTTIRDDSKELQPSTETNANTSTQVRNINGLNMYS